MSKGAVLAIGWVGAARMQPPMSTFANTFLYMTRAILGRRGWSAQGGFRGRATVSSAGEQRTAKVQSRCVGAGAESSRSRQTPVPCRWTSQRSNEMREPRRLGLHLWFPSGPLPASGSCAAYQANLNFFQNTLHFRLLSTSDSHLGLMTSRRLAFHVSRASIDRQRTQMRGRRLVLNTQFLWCIGLVQKLVQYSQQHNM